MMEAVRFLIVPVVVIKMNKVAKKVLKKSILKSTDNVFLYIGGHHFSQDYLDAEEVVKAIDPSVRCYWVWEDTEFDDADAPLGQEPYRKGPLLIQLHGIGDPSPLIAHFFTVWANEQKGVLLTSAYSGDKLLEYLQSLLWVQGENEAAERYAVNLQNPDFQRCWLQSFTTDQLQAFLGPISTLNWLDVCGYEMQWYAQLNEHPALELQYVGWYLFANDQISRFKQFEQAFLYQELISHIHYTHPDVDSALVEDKAKDIIKQVQEKGIGDYKSTLLVLKVQLFIENKKEREKLINILADKEIPLDIRVKIVEQHINQVLQTLTA